MNRVRPTSLAALTWCALLLTNCCHEVAAAENGYLQSEPYVVRPRTFRPTDSKEIGVRWVGHWQCVRPHWLLGIQQKGTFPLDSPWEQYGVIAVAGTTGQVKSVEVDGLFFAIDSIVPRGEAVADIVLRMDDPFTKSHQTMVCEWNLESGEIGPPRTWHPLLKPLSRVIDHTAVSIDLTLQTDHEPDAWVYSLKHRASGSSVRLPVASTDYEIPLEMSSLSEGSQTTRWYAPGASGDEVVAFEGIRTKHGFLAYAPETRLSCLNPKSPNGIRWELSLAEIQQDITKRVDRVSPLAWPWDRRDSLLIEYVSVDLERRQDDVGFVEIGLADGSMRQRGGFTTDKRRCSQTGWARVSAPDDRVVFFLEPIPNKPQPLQVYSVAEQRLLEPVPNPSTADNLLAVLPTREALLQDDFKLWAVGVGPDNHGRARLVCELFNNDAVDDEYPMTEQ